MSNFFQRLVTPAKQKGQLKGLLRKHDGPTSDKFHEHDDSHDDDDSSLSAAAADRYGGDVNDDSSLQSGSTTASNSHNGNSYGKASNSKNKTTSSSKKKFNSRNFFRRKNNNGSNQVHGNINGGSEDDGYESDNSAGSTRSTSSSFLRYQSRSIWKAKLTSGKTVIERRADGSEVPMAGNGGSSSLKPWPIFDRIYKRQNQLLKKGEVAEDGKGDGSSDDEEDEDDDSEELAKDADGCAGSNLAPPAPIESDATGKEGNQCNQDRSNADRTPPVTPRKNKSNAGSPSNDMPSSRAMNGSPVTTQESGIPTCEMPHMDKTNTQSDRRHLSSPTSPVAAPTPPHLQSWSNDSQSASSPSSDSYPTQSLGQIPKSSTKENSFKLANTHSHIKNTPSINSCNNRTSPSSKPISNRVTIGAKKEDGDILTPLSIPRTICYSLRSAIGDGSARQRNSRSLMERRILRPNGCHLDCGYWSHRGKRSYMEDRFVIEHIGSANKNTIDSKPIAMVSVYDGHGGALASQFCSDWLSSYVRKNEYFPKQLPLAMKDAFVKLDNDFVTAGYLDGSTACACAIVGKEKVICCNAGDSRAIIVKRDGSFVALSEDHKPGRLDETKRINALGGRVIYWGRWRVEGVLAVSRSIGDAKLKPYVTAEPDIVEYNIEEDDMFLVVASDGVWDTMTSDLVAKFVLVNTCKIVDKKLKVDDTLLRWVSRQVSKRARENGSSDNTSCIVTNLKSKM